MTGLISALFAVMLAVVAPLSFCAAAPGEPPPKPGLQPATPQVESAEPATAAPQPVGKREWTVEKHLAVAGQPRVAELKKTADEAYRFIFTDAGVTSSTIVLVFRKGVHHHLQAAEVHLHDYYGSDGKKGVEKTERKLTVDEWNGLQARLQKLDFWNYEPAERFGLDGTDWYLEGVAGDKQLRIKVWSPEAGPFRAACLQFWRTSGTFMGYWADKKE